ncbi:hypothetical protein TSUD_293770 [Trifolium subterraneum]|uniref:Reverse transcriptase domain-containing protein n=1 Tax=Trifolium subterraneum TaxID=3900 RepID=A0A2Z6PPX5_TRISU|nr:hypothetical protein TSUD_293770 [Trifolium subterraneum]
MVLLTSVPGERKFDSNHVRKEGRRSRRDEEHDKAASERSLAGTLSFPYKEAPDHLPRRSKLANYDVNQVPNPLFCLMRLLWAYAYHDSTKNGNEGRDSSVESEEDEEDGVRGMWTEGDLEERESKVGESISLKSVSNVNISQVNSSGPNLGSNNDKEEGVEISKSVEGVRSKEDSRLVDGAGGPQNSTTNHHNIKVGLTQSDNIGCVTKPNRPKDTVSGGEVEQGVVKNSKVVKRVNPIPAVVRKKQQIINNLNLKVPNPYISLQATISASFGTGDLSRNSEKLDEDIRNCNKRSVEVYELDKASKVWQEAAELGVEGDEEEEHMAKRRRLSSLIKTGEWCLGGDFNLISKVGERRGSSSGAWRQGEKIEFIQFIDALEVVDIPLKGKMFTWFNSDGSAMSRLNRFLVSEGFIEKETWENIDIRGNKAFIIKEKLKGLKEALKVWNREVFGFMELKIDKTVKELNEVEELLATWNVDANLINPKELVKQFCRRRKNQIVTLKKDGEWIQGVAEIKGEVQDHYSKQFFKEWSNKPFLQGFHENSFLPKALTASFLTLIPKKDHPQNLFDYCPICLIGSLYKILSKLLASWMKRVLGKLISNCQSAFLPQRQILDGVLVLNEIIDLAKRRNDDCLLFKVDFERAYDTISWGFLEKMMAKMGFSEAWLKWMRACIFESSMFALVNGSPTADFNVGRGFRQGDPLSPFLFLIVAEGLTGLMRKVVELGKFKGYRLNNNIQFQILQFADDTILMGEGIWDNIRIIKTLLRSFELVSGLKINFVKSKLYGLKVDSRLLEAGSAFLSCRSEVIPFKFLGIPVGANPRRQETWKPVVDAMIKRLNSWSSRQLSYGGRITLINSMVRIQRNFLWGGGINDKKLCWVKWDQICLPKESGGLGVKNLELFNLALLSKWKWRLLSDGDAIWDDLLRFRYGHLPTQMLGRDTHLSGAKPSIWWKDVVSLGRDFETD